MKRRMMTWAIVFLSIAALALVLYPLAGTLGQGHGGGGGSAGGGGNAGGGQGSGRPGGEESTTNLSYPANFYGNALQTGTIGTAVLNGAFPTSMSYGCAIPETIGTTTYPNTSCVDSGGVPLPYEACVAKCTPPNSAPVPVERIYWQKNSSNIWQAGYNWSNPEVSPKVPLPAEYIDWGDNLEGKTWPVQVLRVETNTFSTLPTLNPGGTSPLFRFEVWHVFGQGTNELWGVHATNPASESESPVPYVYVNTLGDTANWPYGVNVTPTARLNIAKLAEGFPTEGCPATATGSTQSPYSPTWVVNEETGQGHWAYVNEDTTLTPVPYTNDMLYGAELNIKGSYVYGYNWNLRSEAVSETVGKSGWWRLTFYTSDKSIDFVPWVGATAGGLAPPTSTESTPGLLTSPLAVIEPAADTGLLLYVPQVDATNQLTYLDICIAEGKAGGGGGKKGGN